MTEQLKKQLRIWADLYETKDFITHDPIQFPHHYTKQPDIEISGLLVAWISFGNRSMILKKAAELEHIMEYQPYTYLISREWEKDFPPQAQESFYRTCSRQEMNRLFRILWDTYKEYPTLEKALSTQSGSPRERLCQWMGVSTKSPQKKLNMFLRWMIRQDSPVDFGLWHSFSQKDLIIPLDTHVSRMAYSLKLTENQAYSLKQAERITDALRQIFPDDPCKGDFALFGYGVGHKNS